MAMERDKVVCYGGVESLRVDEVADAVSLHLNFLETDEGRKEGHAQLADVREVVIEHVEQVTMSSQLFDQFRELFDIDAQLASMFRMKLLRQQVLGGVLSFVYQTVFRKLTVVEGDYDDTLAAPIIRFLLPTIRDNKERYLRAVKGIGDRYEKESKMKAVIEQVVGPPLTDLALSQARMNGELRHDFRIVQQNHDELSAQIQKQFVAAEANLSELNAQMGREFKTADANLDDRFRKLEELIKTFGQANGQKPPAA